jgi:BASS family bile acid:Na+ symporter
MFAFFRSVVPIAVPVFVVSTMLNVGLTQKLSEILERLKEWPWVVRMLIANFILVPLVMIVALSFTSFDPALETGLLVFALCAGAPFLIKLTQTTGHDLALGAATMLLLMVATVAYAPIALPLFLPGVTVDAWSITRSLLLQMILPIALGMLAARFLTSLARTVQPWVGRLGNHALYVVIGATLIGYLPNMVDVFGTGAIFVGLAFVAAAFGIGYLTGRGADHLQDVGGLGTAQRNTAAGLIVATQNFDDPNVLVMLTLANTLGIVMLLLIAKALSSDNKASTTPV